MEERKIEFTKQLLDWFDEGQRPLPWKGIKDPYLIWVSEIILQQTRVEQGLPYYERFIAAFPTVADLALAEQDKVLRQWQGLGYYSRARNMHAAAKHIVSELSGQFPRSYDELLKLKGVGPYTAAAIASFAFGETKAVVDGNVYRVLSRFFDIEHPIDSSKGKKYFEKLANELIPNSRPADFNQAIMDLGATICMPKRPKCENCYLSKWCVAFKDGSIQMLPKKKKKTNKRERFFNYLVIEYNGGYFLRQRQSKDIWKGLYEFPLIESSDRMNTTELTQASDKIGLPLHFVGHTEPKYAKRTLTHQTIHVFFWKVNVEDPAIMASSYQYFDRKDLSSVPLPKVIDLYLNDNSLTLFD